MSYPYIGRSDECMLSYYSDAADPFGCNLGSIARIQVAARQHEFLTLVIAAGGIHNFKQAEACVAMEQADIIGDLEACIPLGLVAPNFAARIFSSRASAFTSLRRS
jgi:hypothetical protein